MADLFILLPEAMDGAPLYGWRQYGRWATGEAPPAGLTDPAAVAFVPGTSVTRHEVHIAARKPSEARQAALFAIEDDVAEPVDRLHIALGTPGENDQRAVLVTSAADMAAWTAWLAANGYPSADLVAAHSLMPENADLYEAPGEYLVRKEGRVFAVDEQTPEDLLQLLAPQPPGAVYGAQLARKLGTVPAGEGARDRAAYLQMLAEGYEAATPGSLLSLRQGIYAIRSPFSLGWARRWGLVGALAASVLVLWLASVALETSAYRSQTDALRTETARIVNSAVPAANGNVQEALAILRQTQRTGAASVRATMASAALYEALGESDNAEIRSMRYDAASGQLTALVVIANYAEADAIAGRLEEAGLNVRLGQARQTGERVLGEFVIEGAAT